MWELGLGKAATFSFTPWYSTTSKPMGWSTAIWSLWNSWWRKERVMATLNESVYNPEGQQDPVRGLTLAIRGLRLGGRVQLPDGTLVISQVMNNGPRKERRF